MDLILIGFPLNTLVKVVVLDSGFPEEEAENIISELSLDSYGNELFKMKINYCISASISQSIRNDHR